MIERMTETKAKTLKRSHKNAMMLQCYERSICAKAKAERIVYSETIIRQQ